MHRFLLFLERQVYVKKGNAPTLLEDDRDQEQRQSSVIKIRKLLRFCPSWKKGHFYLMQCSYSLHDFDSCYVSCQAVLKLGVDSSEEKIVKRYLSKCYLKTRSFLRAKTEILKLLEREPESLDLKEDLAAACMGLGDKESLKQAHEILGQIADEEISNEARVARTYLNDKLKSSE